MCLLPLPESVEKHRMKNVRCAFCRGRENLRSRAGFGFWCGADFQILDRFKWGNMRLEWKRKDLIQTLDNMREEESL